MSLESSRAVQAKLATGTPPVGWPTDPLGQPVPKCTILDCGEPAVAEIQVARLDGRAGMSVASCDEHLDHFGRAAARWVRT